MSRTIDLSSFTSARGFVIRGAAAGDAAGAGVSDAGDVNGDGLTDLLVGAYASDAGGVNAGAAYVLYGKAGSTHADIDLATLAPADGYRILGSSDNDLAGRSLSSAGDVNGDGIADMILGADGHDTGGTDAGAAYVIYGKLGGTRADIDLQALAPADGFRLQGDVSGDLAGRSVSSAGDINADGFDDLLIGAVGNDAGAANAGMTYVVFGKAGATRANIDLGALAPADGFMIVPDTSTPYATLSSGQGVSSAGDINGDGIDDLIVGALRFAPTLGFGHVVYGKAGATRANVDLGALTPADGFEIVGDASVSVLSASVSSAGDVNGDGLADIIVGGMGYLTTAAQNGSAYVIYGKAGNTRTEVNVAALASGDGFAMLGDPRFSYVRLGNVSAAGDVNGDGLDDVVIGPAGAVASTYNAIPAYVVFGKAGVTRGAVELGAMSAGDGVVITGATSTVHAGIVVSSAGDVNNDGFDDLIVGSPGSVTANGSSGAAYVIYGGPTVPDPEAVDDALVAVAGMASTWRAQTLLANDRLPVPATITAVGNATGGVAVLNADGTITFTPTAGAAGTAGFDYTIFDGEQTDVGHVTVAVRLPAPAATISLVALVPAQGFRIEGAMLGDYAGAAVSSAGDVNGDGLDDVIVGAYLNDAGGGQAGAAYVVYGRAGGTRANLDLATLGAADGFSIQGDAAGDLAGSSVSAAGDVNGDGLADVIVGASGSDAAGPDSGAAYVIFGTTQARSLVDLTTLAAGQGYRIQGPAADSSAGRAVAGVGDVNGDGVDDLLVGAPGHDAGGTDKGSAYLVFGRVGDARTVIDLATLAAQDGVRLAGEVAFDGAGVSVARAGDVNGDGIDDLIVGANGHDAGGALAGAAYVIYGRPGPSPFPANLDLGNALASSNGFRILGAAAGDDAGRSVSAAGDVNGDGIGDLVVGASGNDAGGANAGAAYVIFGTAGLRAADVNLASLAPTDGFRIRGATEFDSAGWSVSAAGDVNGDGFADLLVGAIGEGAAGAAYVVFGKLGGTRANIDLGALASADGARIPAVLDRSLTGASVAGAGDLNGDGFADLVVGAPRSYSYAGAAHVIYGSSTFGKRDYPNDLTLAGGNVLEGAANGTVVGTFGVVDPDAADTHTFALLDDAGGRFAIDAATGVLSLRDRTLVDREAAAAHAVTVRVTDSTGLAYDEQFAIAVQDADEFDLSAPVDADEGPGGAVAGSATAGTRVGIIASAVDADATTNTVTYALTDTAGGRFAIDATTGAVTVAAGGVGNLTDLTYTVGVRATSADGSTSAGSFSIVVTTLLPTLTITGTAAADVLPAAPVLANYVINGMGSADTIVTNVGADTVRGGGGNDTIRTGDGNDVITFLSTGDGFDNVDGGFGVDEIRALGNGTVIGLTNVVGVERITANGFASVEIRGGNTADTLDLGTVVLDGITLIDARGGNDRVVGGAGADTIVGGSGDDVLAGGGGNDVFLVGVGANADSIDGGSGYDIIRATAAGTIISLRALANVEEINANGLANVALTGSTGADTLDFTGAALVGIFGVDGLAGDDTIIGGSGDDIIIGNAGDDVLYGAAGNDTFRVGALAGTDAYNGGPGNDTIVATANDVVIGISSLTGIDQVSAGGFTGVTVAGSANADTLDFSTVLLGVTRVDSGAGDDVLTGSALADTLYGNSGVDTVSGGGGNDTILFEAGCTDVVNGGSGTDTLLATAVNATITWTTVSGVEAVSNGGYSGVRLLGTANGDVLNFSTISLTGIAQIDGGAGNDTITGSAGSDRIYGGAGTDTISAGAGADTIQVSGATNEVINGGADEDTILALANNSSVVWTKVTGVEIVSGGSFTGMKVLGTASADTLDLSAVTLLNVAAIDGGGGADTITGSAGVDTIIGGAGNDTIRFGVLNADVVNGGAGTDTLRATVNNASIQWTGTSVTGVERVDGTGFTGVAILGAASNDTIDLTAVTLVNVARIDAGSGNDTVRGSAVADLILGGFGTDTLTGNGGNDLFRFTVQSESLPTFLDRITDFVRGQDRVDLAAMDANSTLAGQQAFTFIGSAAFSGVGQLRYHTNIAGETRIQGDTNGDQVADFEVALVGTHALTSADFILV